MIDLYEKYIEEREGQHLIKEENGFITYLINGDQCYISDFFVSKNYRRSGIGYRMADKVTIEAKERGCKYLTCQVDLNAFGVEASTITILNYGFKIGSAQNNFIQFIKEI